MKPIAKVYTAIIFLFLFAPIAILLVFSFNSGNSLSVFSGFSLYWYKELFQDSNTLEALRNTLVLALCAAILSTVLGTAASVGMNKLRSKYMRAAMNTVTNLPMVNPEIRFQYPYADKDGYPQTERGDDRSDYPFAAGRTGSEAGRDEADRARGPTAACIEKLH